MERFAIKIDKNLRANLYKICRLCGIDNPDKVKVLDDATIVNLEEGEPELWKKVLDCIGLLITKDDKMPQFMCTLCVDKINDFFEFREMCYATDIQTRKLLGIKEEPKQKAPGKIQSTATECKVEAQDVKQPVPALPVQKPARKRRNADMEICNTLKDIKTDDIKDIKTPGASTSLSSAKKKRLKLESSDYDSKSSAETKLEPAAKTSPASKLGLAKKRLKIEPNLKEKKELRQTKTSKLMKNKLKVEAPAIDDRRPTPFQLKKKKALEMLKQRKLAKQVAVVKVEKMRKASIDAKIKEEAIPQTVTSGSNQSKVKLKEACTICSDSYVNKTLLDKHVKTTHIPLIARYHCVYCNETLKKNMEIKNHNLWHKLSKTPFQCGNCSESSCSIYTYTKHIRDCSQVSYIDAQVPDWHCPQCQGVYETTYLFNIHSCVSNTLTCPGCDRSHKWKEDYFKHIPTCAAAVHRIPSYMTPHIQVKNEAEHPSSPISHNHSHSLPPAVSVPTAQLSQSSNRITPPLMDSNQCVVIPGNVSLTEEAPSSSPKGSCKKSKRITKKDLKRFDKLLKSTMTTLVSIKQEPTQCEETVDHQQTASLDTRSNVSESPSASPEPADDHFYNDDDESTEESSFSKTMGTIKQEIVDEGYRDLYSNIEVNVKRELTDNETETLEAKRKTCETKRTSPAPDSQPPKPVLKLKITKEHGTLNSILLDSPKSEKKKKKKKRKEEKHREREEAENMQRLSTKIKVLEETAKNPCTEPSVPLPQVVHVKEEKPDIEEKVEPSEEQIPSDAVHHVPSIVAATSGSLQISCVSEGVNFNGADDKECSSEEGHTDAVLSHETFEHENISPSSEAPEPVDIKPNLEDLVPTLQIASVSSGVDLIQQTVKRKRGRPPGSKKTSISTPKILSVSCGTEVARFETELEHTVKRKEETCEKVDNNENVFDYTQVKVKEEVVDPAFEEQNIQTPSSEVEATFGKGHSEEPIFNKEAEENAYIANIDFNNLSIKQEKEYIDDGLDNPVPFDDDDDSDTDSESSSDSDGEDSESDREYRELPSENEEASTTDMLNTVLPPIGLHISEVRSEVLCSQPTEKTESEKGAEHSSEGTTKSKAATEYEVVANPNPNSDLSTEGESPFVREKEGKTHDETTESSSSLETSGAAKSESKSVLRDSNLASNDTPAQELSQKNECLDNIEKFPLFSEVDKVCNVGISTEGTINSMSQAIPTNKKGGKSLEEHFSESLHCLNAITSLADKQDDLGQSGLAGPAERNLLPVGVSDNFSPAEVNFTIMPVEKLSKTDFEGPTSSTSARNEDGSKPPGESRSLPQTDEVDIPVTGDDLGIEVNADDELREAALTEESMPAHVAESTDMNALDFPLPAMVDIKLGNEAEQTVDTVGESPISEENHSSTIESSLGLSMSKASITPVTIAQISPSKMLYNSTEILTETSQHMVNVRSQDTVLNPEGGQTTDASLLSSNIIADSHIEQQTILLEHQTSDNLTIRLPSFNETPPANSQLFNASIELPELDRQNLDAVMSIDLGDVLSNNTLQPPAAVAVLSPNSSACNVNDSSSNIPTYSSNLSQMSSEASFLETNLNLTELCRNNASLDSLSDFHINTSTAGHLHNLIPSTDAHPAQLISELSEIASSTNNTDLSVPVLSEEVQNLLNEDTVAASNFELNDSILRARCSSSMNEFSPSAPVAVSVPNFTDLENVNEIAENNNNANIERELQDELGNALAAAIADRSPNNDEIDENNAINENRANFDLT